MRVAFLVACAEAVLVAAHAQSNGQTISVSTLAGQAKSKGSTDGLGHSARFNRPMGVAIDAANTIYVADADNQAIRKMSAAGLVTTLAGTAGSKGSADGATAHFSAPAGLAIGSDGTLFVADALNNTIRAVTASGVVTTVAGAPGEKGSADGKTADARFNCPHSVATDASGILYIADTYNHTIRKISPGGDVTTLAGKAGERGSNDGLGAAARFKHPAGIAVDGQGTVYVTDNGNNTVRKISPDGRVTTMAGTAGRKGEADGTGAAARFWVPTGIAVSARGIVYVADNLNCNIRQISPNGVVTTLAGDCRAFGSADGTGLNASFNCPFGLAVAADGTVYVADTANHTIRVIK